ncbi:MAG: hypothetical protein MJY98_07750 [Fibrobacter sp.]|nr:hypothetical protein [Fibrobacter sp.]
MELTSRLIRPFKRHKESLIGKVNSFVDPIKAAISDLKGKIPNPKGFAGSEDLAENSANLVEEGDSGNSQVAGKVGLLGRLKNFKNSLKEMSDFQKLILLTIAVLLPAGILISTILVGVIKKHKKK